MASNNIGKTFEQEFKECVPPDYYLYRLKDDTSGFYGVSNPCDYILFRSPYLFLVELKTHRLHFFLLYVIVPIGQYAMPEVDGR